MLVILVIGITTAFVTSLSQTAITNKRNQATADALARAKEALIGYAVSDSNRPGELPCPDVDNDGQLTLNIDYSGSNCSSLIGRLPWKTLGLSDLRDGVGERLWYAVSDPFHANSTAVLNSDTAGTISVSGNIAASNIVAIVFSPGNTLAALNQNRSAANINSYSHYLESVITAPNTFKKLTPNDTGSGSYTYNDQIVFVSHIDLMPTIERRIAREVKSCLDDYALDQSGVYPWAVPASKIYYYGNWGSRFGRIPFQPYVADSNIRDFLSDFADLQIAVAACKENAANYAMLFNAGDDLYESAWDLYLSQPTSPEFPLVAINASISAGIRAKDSWRCADIHDHPVSNIVEAKMNDSQLSFNPVIEGMIATSNSSRSIQCDLFSKSYWKDWKTMVFYQVSDNYRPGGSGGSGSITVNSVGAYPAVVAIAGKVVAPYSTPRNPLAEPPSPFLEGVNAHTSTAPANNFETYKMQESSYSTVNDIVICVGDANC